MRLTQSGNKQTLNVRIVNITYEQEGYKPTSKQDPKKERILQLERAIKEYLGKAKGDENLKILTRVIK